MGNENRSTRTATATATAQKFFVYQRTDAKVLRKFETSKCVAIQQVTNVTLVIFQKSLKIVILLKLRYLQRYEIGGIMING